jgi:hypothetical protein
MSRSIWLCLLCLALAAVAGCPSGGTGVDTVAVTGTVTLDGNPVEGANVTFAPKAKDGRAAAGVTDASGHFKLTTVAGGDGALPGSYGVSITKAAAQASAPASDPRTTGGNLTPEQQQQALAAMKAAEAGAGPAAAQSAVPKKYASAATSGFTAEVKTGGGNDFKFEMTSQ